MNLLKLAFLFLTLATGVAYSITESCEISLKEIFGKEVSKEGAKEFLHLQGQITLNRLAWAYLKAQEHDTDTKAATLERTIIELLNDKYTRNDEGFARARRAFENQPLSRTTLSEIGPYLQDILSEKFKEEDQSFVINESDIKLLAIIAKREKESAHGGKFDHRMMSSKSPAGMLNFVKLVNSSYRLKPNESEESLNTEVNLRGLEKVIGSMQKKINNLLDKIELPLECKNADECRTDVSMADLFQTSQDVQKIFWNSIQENIESDDSLLSKLNYGDMWLQVKNATPKVEHVKTVVVSPNKSKKISSSTAPKKLQAAGVIIEDPVGIIIKDRANRKRDQWKKFDTEFLQIFARAILDDAKVFEHKGRLFDRRTAKMLSPETALYNLPPKRKEEARKLLAVAHPSIKIKFGEALGNGSETFVVGDKLFDKQGKSIDPTIVIANVMSAKTGAKYEAKRYKGMNSKYLAQRANALKNNRPYFNVSGQTLDTLTGRDISSPFRAVAATDAKIEKKRRKIYENLSDLEIVKNFHRDQTNASCNYYGVIDKSSAVLKVFHNNGKEVFRSEALIGAEKSDMRTRWTTYNNSSRVASSSTGAGIYTIRPQNINDSYNKKAFNNNILSFVDDRNKETVFAVHQVPVGLQTRYSRFGTNDPDDRRVSGGCANLKLDDFKAAKKWLKPSCKVYVLPEEKNNKFTVTDNKIKLTSETPVEINKSGLYFYSGYDKTALPISIKIRNQAGNTEKSQAFVKALQSEKSKLMKMYGLTNDEYNDLAMLSYGILGNESDFGQSTKLKIKENAQFAVITARLLKSGDPKGALNTSRGLTQIKFLPQSVFSKEYPEVKKDNLTNPRNAAVATIAYLALASNEMREIAIKNKADPSKLKITKENMMNYMGYLYQGGRGALSATDKSKQATPEFNGYYRKLQLHMSYIEVRQQVK